jgi:hypothetical protein
MRQVRQEDFVLRCRSCLVSNTAQAHERSEGVARPAHLKASSEAEATIAPVLIATVRGRSTAHRWADKNGQLALTNGGYSILQNNLKK